MPKVGKDKGKKVVYASKGMMVNANMSTSKNMRSKIKSNTPTENAFVANYSKLITGPNS